MKTAQLVRKCRNRSQMSLDRLGAYGGTEVLVELIDFRQDFEKIGVAHTTHNNVIPQSATLTLELHSTTSCAAFRAESLFSLSFPRFFPATMKTTWKEIAPVPSSQEFLDIVLSRTQRRLPTQIRAGFKISRIRAFYTRKVKFTQETFTEKLQSILDG